MSMNEIENFVQGGIWTHDPQITSLSLYHLSYSDMSEDGLFHCDRGADTALTVQWVGHC